MARIPRQVSRLVTPSGRTGGVPIPSDIIDTSAGIEAQGLIALGGGVSNLAQALSQIKIRENNADDLLAADNIAASIQRTKDTIEQDKIDSPDPKTWGAIADKRWSSAFDAVSLQTFHNPDTKDRAFLQFAAEQNHNKAITRIRASVASTKIAVKATRDTLLTAIARGDDVKQEKLLHQEALKNVLGDDDLVRIAMEDVVALGEKELRENSIDNIKPLLISAYETDGKQAALAVLSNAVDNLVKEGILNEVEAAQTDKVLGDWVDQYVAGREQKAKAAVKLTTQESYQDLMPMMFDPSQAQDRFEAVEQSKMLKADKDKWKNYVRGSYKPSPPINTNEGFLVSFNAVYDAQTLKLSPTEAYDVLLKARFGKKREITDEQFNWAIGKIANPYPKNMIDAINKTVKDVASTNTFLWIDDKRNTKTAEAFIAWIDDQIKQGKTDITPKEMHGMAAQLRVGNDRLVDVGQVIDIGGRGWQVVDFDKNGEALYEIIP